MDANPRPFLYTHTPTELTLLTPHHDCAYRSTPWGAVCMLCVCVCGRGEKVNTAQDDKTLLPIETQWSPYSLPNTHTNTQLEN